jgi:hypothetical protein
MRRLIRVEHSVIVEVDSVGCQMPRYVFNFRQGKFSNAPSQHFELPSVDAAWRQATAMLSDLARDIASELRPNSEWMMEVEDTSGKVVVRLRFVSETFD